jgi:hypothetical protein
MKKLVLIMLMCMGVAYAQIPYNSYPPAGALSGTEKVLINQGNADALYLTTTADIADLFSGSITPTFNNILTGTNTNTLTTGSGGQITFSGSGVINANTVNGVTIPLSASLVGTNSSGQFGAISVPLSLAFGGTNATTASNAINNLLPTQTGESGNCLGTNGTTSSWVTCGSGGGGAFNALTSGTNTSASMLVGSGATLSPIGTGIVSANQVNAAVVPLSAAVLGSNGGSQLIALTLGANLVQSGSVIGTSQLINSQTGLSYIIQASDAGVLILFNNAAPVAVTLPQAGTTGFLSGFSFDVQNKGAGVVTITPTTSTINSGSTLTFSQNTGCTVTSDGGNYQISACTAVSSGGGSGGAFSSIGTGTNTTATMTVGSGATLTTSGTGVVNANQLGGSALATYFGALPVAIGNSSAGAGTYTYASALGLNTSPTVVLLKNTSPATGTPGAQQGLSAALQFEGQGWYTAGSASRAVDWFEYVAPTAGTPGSFLIFANSVNGGAANAYISMSQAGVISSGGFTPNITNSANNCPNCYFTNGTNTGISAGSTQVLTFSSTVTTANVPVMVNGTAFTITPTGCTPSATSGGPFGGTITLAAGPCTSIVVTMNGATGFTATHGYDCNVGDQTAQAAGTWIPRWGQTANTATTATIPIPAAAGATDVISFTCTPY